MYHLAHQLPDRTSACKLHVQVYELIKHLLIDDQDAV